MTDPALSAFDDGPPSSQGAADVDAALALAARLEQSERPRALRLSGDALSLARQLGDQVRIARSAYQLATLEWRTGHHDEALEHANSALACFRALGDQEHEAWCLRLLGNIHGVQSQYAPACEFLQAAARLSRQVGNLACLASCLNNLGIIANELGDYAAALEYLFEALQTYAPNDSNIPSSLNNLASLYQQLGQYERALSFHEQALEIARAEGVHPLTAAFLHNLAETRRRRGEVQPALAALKESLALARQIDDPQTEMLALDSLGLLHGGLGDAQAAQRCYEQGLAIVRRVNHPLGEVRLLMHHAAVLPHASRQAVLERALTLAQRVGLKAEVREVHDLLVAFHREAQAYQSALHHHEQARSLERELFNEAQDRRTQALHIQYEVARAREVNAAQQALNEQLQRANEELDAFSYSISHDLRAPIRHITGFAALLRQTLATTENQQAERFLGIIETAVQRMNTLVDALLDFARSAREPLRVGKVDLNAVLQELRRDFAAELHGREVVWRIGELPTLPGDATLLRQVLYNLLSNALKYSQPRTPTVIEVRAERAEREWVVQVSDNGVGFDARYQDKLFGVFQRLHRAEEFEGVGIGLANVQRIVARHGGRVWATSEPGQGATFSFALPV